MNLTVILIALVDIDINIDIVFNLVSELEIKYIKSIKSGQINPSIEDYIALFIQYQENWLLHHYLISISNE